MALLPYLSLCKSAGTSVERLLTGAGIPADPIDNSSAVVPMGSALRFGELACRDLGTEHLGLRMIFSKGKCVPLVIGI